MTGPEDQARWRRASAVLGLVLAGCPAIYQILADSLAFPVTVAAAAAGFPALVGMTIIAWLLPRQTGDP